MHRRDADDQLVHEGGEGGIDDKADQHARRQLADQPAQQRNQHRDREIADAAEAERPAHPGVVGRGRDGLPGPAPRDQ